MNQLFFTLGGDEQVASFNGKLAYVGVYLGPQSFTKEKNLEYRFLYGEGAS